MSNILHSHQKAILVTGGAGYIGSHTVRFLATRNERVIVLDNLAYGHREAIVSPGVEFVEGDISDRALLDKIFQEHSIDAVIHFAAYAYVGESVTDPLKYYRNNLGCAVTLLEAMEAHECGRFIFSSTCAIYGNPVSPLIDETHPKKPINPYGRSKLMLERVLRDCEPAFGLKSVCLRYFNASGCSSDGMLGEDHTPETHLIPRVLMSLTGEIDHITLFGTDYETPDGTCVRDYIHVDDLAEAHAKALDYLRSGGNSTACNLGTGTGVSVKEIICLAEEICGKKVPLRYGERRKGDPSELVAAADKARAVLGWSAKHTNPQVAIESAWKWISGPNRGRYGK